MFLRRNILQYLVILCVTVLLVSLAGQQPAARVSAQDKEDNDRAIVADDFLKNRPGKLKSGPKRSPATYRRVTAANRQTGRRKLQVGVTIWKFEPGSTATTSGERSVTGSYWNKADWIPKRVEADIKFRQGDALRISIESPRDGYLYVVNRDLLADGTFGETNLIFPTQGEDNRLKAGKLIDLPSPDDPPFKATPKPGQASELLTVIVTSSPLQLQLGPTPIPISTKQLGEWVERWGGDTDRLEMNGGAGQVRTLAEQLAASAMDARQLTRDDPMPQTIYSLTPKNMDGLLFNLQLSYVR